MRYLLTGAASALIVTLGIAVPWPYGVLAVAAGLVSVLLVRRSWLRSRELLVAGFVIGAMILVASGLASRGMTGQPWLPPPASVGLELLTAALGVSVIVAAAGRR